MVWLARGLQVSKKITKYCIAIKHICFTPLKTFSYSQDLLINLLLKHFNFPYAVSTNNIVSTGFTATALLPGASQARPTLTST